MLEVRMLVTLKEQGERSNERALDRLVEAWSCLVSLDGSYMGVVHSNISSVCSLNLCTFLYVC